MKTYNIKETAARIRDLRVSFGYTQEKAAGLLESDRRSLSHIENGSRGCSLDMLIRISALYEVPMDYLLFGWKGDAEMVKVGIDMAISCLVKLRDNLQGV